MKRRLGVAASAAAATAFAVGMAGCSTSAPSDSSAGGRIPLLRIGYDQAIASLDLTKNLAATDVVDLSLETLMSYGPQGQIVPNLATSVDQTSPTTYVYHLRHGVKFWDGTELTADDVVYSLNYDRATGSQASLSFLTVKDVQATDRNTVTVTLTQPDATWRFEPATMDAMIFQKKFAEEHQGTWGKPGVLVMGTGPWKPTSLDTAGATFVANPTWWGGKVPIDTVKFVFYASEQSQALGLRSGQVDFTPYFNNPKSYAATAGVPLTVASTCNIEFFSMNTQVAPWNDVHVRRAVAYALNRDDLIAAAGGYAKSIPTYIPPDLLRSLASQEQVDGMLRSIPEYPYDLAKARQELAQSAYPNGFSSSIAEVSGNSTTVDQAIVAQLKKIGIQIDIKLFSSAAYNGLSTGDAAKRPTEPSFGYCFVPDPGTYSDFLGKKNVEPGAYNIADYAPPVVDQLLSEGVATQDNAKRFDTYTRLFRVLQTDLPYIGLYSPQAEVAMSDRFTYPDFNFRFSDTPYALHIKAKP